MGRPLPRSPGGTPALAIPQPQPISPFFAGSTFAAQQQGFVSSPAHSPTIERGAALGFNPLAQSFAPDMALTESAMSAEMVETELRDRKAKEMSLSELARGFGFDDFAGGPQMQAEGDLEVEDERRLRQTSGELIKTQREDEDEVEANAARKVRRYSDGVDEGKKKRHHSKSYSVSEGAYSRDEDDDEDMDMDMDEDEDEYSNPSDEERARKLKKEQQKKKTKVVPNPDHWLDGGDDESIISNPSDEEHHHKLHLRVSHSHHPSDSSNNAHRVNNNFRFPPRPLPVPPSLPSTANSFEPNALQAQQAVAQSHSRRTSLNANAPEFVFGSSTQDPPPQLPTLRFGSGSGFGSISSQTGLPPPPAHPQPAPPTNNPLSQSTFGKLNAFAKEFKPTFTFTSPAGAPTANFSNPPPPPQTQLPIRAISPGLFGPPQPQNQNQLPLPGQVPSARPVPVPVEATRAGVWLSPNPSETDTEDVFNDTLGGVRRPTSADVRDYAVGRYLYPQGMEDRERRGSAPAMPVPSQHFNTISKQTPGRNNPNLTLMPEHEQNVFNTASPESKKRMPIPDFFNPPEVEQFSQRTSPSNMKATRYSIDDGLGEGVALPAIARNKGVMVSSEESARTPTVAMMRQKYAEEQEEETEMSVSEDLEEDEEEDGDYEGETEEEDFLLGQIEDILDEKFDAFRKDISGLANFKAEIDNLKQDALLDAFTTRVAAAMQNIITPDMLTLALSQQSTLQSANRNRRTVSYGGNLGYTGLPELEDVNHKPEFQMIREVVDDNHMKMESTLNQALAAIINHISETTSSATARNDARPLPVPSAEAFADAIITKLKNQGVIGDITKERERLAEVVDGVLDTLKPILEQRQDSRSRSTSDPFLDPPAPVAHTSSIEPIIKLLDERLPDVGKSRERSSMDTAILSSQVASALLPHLTTLKTPPLDIDLMIFKLSEAVKPQISQVCLRCP
ncbi:hypothetical protein BT69DRAFT_96722 [Atractiella rhizophila]|nr:hypothetical protein BT69DRAFT_96722 [Atractiella rhizophila]